MLIKKNFFDHVFFISYFYTKYMNLNYLKSDSIPVNKKCISVSQFYSLLLRIDFNLRLNSHNKNKK